MKISFVTILLMVISFGACQKYKLQENKEMIIGKWISEDKSDTLNFVDEENFYKSDVLMHSDHYDYQLFVDSIEIRYSGVLYILVLPTRHKYRITGNTLTIDLRDKDCYGFDKKEITYLKK